MKKLLMTLILAITMVVSANAYKYDYKTVPGDPMHSLMYTLPNGLQVFMTVNKDKPRIQTYIAVRVGGKNDPAETTGLAHYFEHLMFKGTKQFGTKDYKAEKTLLDKIEQLFETYRRTTDEAKRQAIYHEIDSISYQASLIAIPNEYDKLMAAIGAEGTNAYTSQDVTCYVEDIPSNQIDNWARIQADRFANPVPRGFHTELETIYEEKNMSLTNDARKSYEALFAAMFPSHPYGTQTVLGTQEHLKNPSITNVKNYHSTWYVPNNMAICLSGDFDPDEMVDIITRYFGDFKPNTKLPKLEFAKETPLTQPVSRDVIGKEAETLYMGWRIPAAKDKDMVVLSILGEVLQNGKCGIIDNNVTLPQRTLSMGSFIYDMADQGSFVVVGRPKAGQTLEQVRDIALEQVDLLRQGKFDDELLPAIVNIMKLDIQQQLENNGNRASMFVNAFVNSQPWGDYVAQLDNLGKVTKADVVAAANRYLGKDNYVAIYKRQGEDPNELKIAKPKITPIATNRDTASAFLTEILANKVKPIEPSFVDFEKDLVKASIKDSQVQVLYNRNMTNDIASLTLIYECGTSSMRPLAYANQYLTLLGTKDMTAAQIKNEFYKLAFTYRIAVSNDRTYVVLEGLSENLPKALKLYETLIKDAVNDSTVWNQLVERNIKRSNDAKSNQSANFSALANYALYGSRGNSPSSLAYTPEQLKQLDPDSVLIDMRRLSDFKHRIIYYGPQKLDNVLAMLEKDHVTPSRLVDAPAGKKFNYADTKETIIYVAPYDAKQLYMTQIYNTNKMYDADSDTMRKLYNEYFGGGMNSIVFQEMRESRSLAYSAWAGMTRPSKLDKPYMYRTQIATQNDKLGDAIDAFNLIINEMPVSQAAFDLTKEGLESRLRTQRVIKDDIAWYYISAQDLGLNYLDDKVLFEKLPGMTIDDVIKYQQDNVKGHTYTYAILGKVEDLDIDALKKMGKVVMLTPEQIFGY